MPKQTDEPALDTIVKDKNGHSRSVASLLEADDAVKDQVSGFVDFVREKAIVGLAIGFVVGQQAQGVIKQLISSFVDPAFKLFFGENLSSRTFTLHVGRNSADFGWGGMVYILLNLIFVLLTIYALIKIFKLDKLDRPKETTEIKSKPKKSHKHVK
jgi:large-conductance mechanosensitive channel